LYSAVVTIDSGKITGIVWDNGCWSGSGTVRIIFLQSNEKSSKKGILLFFFSKINN